MIGTLRSRITEEQFSWTSKHVVKCSVSSRWYVDWELGVLGGHESRIQPDSPIELSSQRFLGLAFRLTFARQLASVFVPLLLCPGLLPSLQVSQEGDVLTREILECGKLLQRFSVPLESVFEGSHGIHMTLPRAYAAVRSMPLFADNAFLGLVAVLEGERGRTADFGRFGVNRTKSLVLGFPVGNGSECFCSQTVVFVYLIARNEEGEALDEEDRNRKPIRWDEDVIDRPECW